MKVSGYLSKKKSNGNTYIYLRRSYRENNKVKHEYIFSFGTTSNALEKMYWYRDHPEQFPKQLKDRGYGLGDLYDWIMTMETKVTSTGKKFEY